MEIMGLENTKVCHLCYSICLYIKKISPFFSYFEHLIIKLNKLIFFYYLNLFILLVHYCFWMSCSYLFILFGAPDLFIAGRSENDKLIRYGKLEIF